MMNASEDFKQHLNRTATYLSEGQRWHSRVANMLRSMPNKRGYARVHDDQALLDAEKLVGDKGLNKLCQDHLMYLPSVDMTFVARAESYSIATFEDFKTHFDVWLSREDIFTQTTNGAIDLARTTDITLYNALCCMTKDLQIEYMRARLIRDSLADCEWSKHHCAIVSKWLHEHAEDKPGDWNINIG